MRRLFENTRVSPKSILFINVVVLSLQCCVMTGVHVVPSEQYSEDGLLEFTCRTGPDNFAGQIIWYNATTGLAIEERVPSLHSHSGIHINPQKHQLLISNPERAVIYSVYCAVTLGFDHVISKPAIGYLAFLDSSELQTINRTVYVGQTIEAECNSPLGLPRPSTFWEKLGVLHPNSQVSKYDTLVFDSLKLSDNGTYLCLARNIIATRQVLVLHLHVRESLLPVSAEAHSKVILKCTISEKTLVHWRRMNGTIDWSRSSVHGNSLLISDVRLEDAGIYRCGHTDIRLKVIFDSPPNFLLSPRNLSIQVGQTALFHCISVGWRNPSIYWELPDLSPVFPSPMDQQSQSHVVHGNGTLVIKNVTQKDDGRYRCVAHSSVDTVHRTAFLKVLDDQNTTTATELRHPLIVGLPPFDQIVEPGATVYFPCRIIPGAEFHLPKRWSVSWNRDNQDVSRLDDRLTVMSNGDLRIFNVTQMDAGRYSCIVGEPNVSPIPPRQPVTAYSAQLIVNRSAQSPDLGQVISSPANLRVLWITDRSLALTWDGISDASKGDLNPRSLKYMVEQFDSSQLEIGWRTIANRLPFDVLYLDSLRPGIPYYFIVRHQSETGKLGWASLPLGPITLSKTLSTNEQKQTSSPHSTMSMSKLAFSIHSDNTTRLSWDITDSSTTDLLKMDYHISYKMRPIYDCAFHVSQDQHSIFIKAPSGQLCDYQFSNSKIFSGFLSRLKTLQKRRDKSNLTKFVTTSFSAPVVVTGKIKHNGYTIWQNEVILQSLTPFSCYLVTVGMRDASISSSELIFSEGSPPSTAPRNITIDCPTENDFLLKWQETSPPHEVNGLILGYSVFVYQSNMLRSKVYNVTSNFFHIKVPKFRRDYSIKLATRTCSGLGSLSSSIPLICNHRIGNKKITYIESVLFRHPWIIFTLFFSILSSCILLILALSICYRNNTYCHNTTRNLTKSKVILCHSAHLEHKCVHTRKTASIDGPDFVPNSTITRKLCSVQSETSASPLTNQSDVSFNQRNIEEKLYLTPRHNSVKVICCTSLYPEEQDLADAPSFYATQSFHTDSSSVTHLNSSQEKHGLFYFCESHARNHRMNPSSNKSPNLS